MSLTGFLDLKEVTETVKPLRPKLSRKINATLRVEPRSKRYTLVGTAFDYLLRFEVQRRQPHAVASAWIAEAAVDMIWKQTDTGEVGLELFWGAEPTQYLSPKDIAERARRIIENAKVAFAAYCQNDTSSEAMRSALAAHAIRLAKLDSILRTRQLDPRFEEADQDDVQDLVGMLSIVPFDELLNDGRVHLNPTFGDTSRIVGGADADIISGDLLIELKVTKKNAIQVRDLDQLLGYFFLARHQRSIDPKFPEIKRAAIYFGRHGYLWGVDVAEWTQNPEFAAVEEWFFKRAKEMFQRKSP